MWPPCAGTLSWLPSVVATQLGGAIAELLKSLLSSPPSVPASASATTSATKFRHAGDLLAALQLHTAADQQLLATAVAGPIAGALVGSVQQGTAPPEAASLLASLVKQFGAEVVRAAPAVALPGAARTTGTVLLELLELLAKPGCHGSVKSDSKSCMSCVYHTGKGWGKKPCRGAATVCKAGCGCGRRLPCVAV